MPIIGIQASSIQLSAGSYHSIQTVTVGASAATSIDFTSIPSTYKHLQLRGMYKQNATTDWIAMSVNGAAISFRHLFWGTGGPTISVYSDSANQYLRLGTGFSSFILDVYDYASANKHKTLKATSGFSNNSSDGSVGVTSNRYPSNTAISSLSFLNTNGNFQQYSTIALYGIEGA